MTTPSTETPERPNLEAIEEFYQHRPDVRALIDYTRRLEAEARHKPAPTALTWAHDLNLTDGRDDVGPWEGERCKSTHCRGRRVVRGFSVSDEDWLAVTGREGGVLCLPCFDVMAQAKGLSYGLLDGGTPGASEDDERAAAEWVREHWNVTSNARTRDAVFLVAAGRASMREEMAADRDAVQGKLIGAFLSETLSNPGEEGLRQHVDRANPCDDATASPGALTYPLISGFYWDGDGYAVSDETDEVGCPAVMVYVDGEDDLHCDGRGYAPTPVALAVLARAGLLPGSEADRLRELLRQARDEDDVVNNEDWRNEVAAALEGTPT